MDNMYLVPANTKKSMLVFGFMRWIDVIIISTGVVTSVLLLLLLSSVDKTWIQLLACLPGIVSGLLILPIPNYHNTLVAIQSIIRFYKERRNYVWRGWCIYDEYKDNK